MTTSARGRHRKLRRNILHTIIATALLAGTFTAVDQSLNATPAAASAGAPGSVDTTFANVAAITGLKFTIGVQRDGKVIATPDYGMPIARFNVDGTVDSTFPYTATHSTSVIVNPVDDSFFVTRFGTTGALVQKRLASGLTGAGTWDSALKGRGNYASVFEFIDSNNLLVMRAASPSLVKLNVATGAQDMAFNTNFSPTPFAGEGQQVKIQTVAGVNKILVAASNGNFGGSLTRYNLDGTLDKVIFNNKDFTAVEVVNVSGQNMIVAGERTEGVLHVFNEDGSVATNQFAQNIKAAANSFGPALQGLGPRSIEVDSAGRIVVGGSFTSPTKYLFRFNSDGTADTTFNTNIGNTFSGTVNDVQITAQDRIYAAHNGGVIRILGEYANPGPRFSTASVSTDGLTLTLDFVEDLVSLSPATNLFTVKNGSATIAVDSTSVSGKRVTLSLASAIGAGQNVSVVYNPPVRDDATTNAVIQTTAGGDALKFTAFNASITNNSTVDQLGPVYTPASAVLAADGVTLTLTYNEPLNATTAAGGAFTVISGGLARTVTSAVPSGSTLVLTLAQGGGAGAATTVAYTAPTVNGDTSNPAVQDALGNDSLSFTAAAVVNNSTLDKTAPLYTPSSAVLSANGATITLTYNEPLNATTAPTSAFVVNAPAGTPRTISSVAISGSQVVLTLPIASAIGSGITTTVTYNAPTPSNEADSNLAVQDTAGNDAVTMSNRPVISNSTLDRVLPTYTTNSAVVATDGMSLTLTYSEPLNVTTAPASTFSVISGGIARTVTSVVTDGAKVILYFASPLSQIATTTVAYTAPAVVIGTSNSAIQDMAGNDAATLASQTAVNNSTVDASGPTYTAGTAVLDATGVRITMTYNEALHARTADPSAFTVMSGSSTRSVTDVTVSGSTITLTLASPVAAGVSTTVSYAAPTSSSLTSNLAVQDANGNDGVSLNSIAITNNSTIDFTLAPNLTGVTAPTTTKIVLSFDKALNATTAATTDFNVSSAGIPIAVTAVTVVGSTVELTLTSAMSTSYQTFVTYTAPTSNTAATNAAIQSTVGNDAASFVKQAVDLLATGTTVTEVVTSPTASPGQKIDLIARMPFTQTGSTSQEIVQQIDPSVIQLTGINDIAYPNGWTLSYCSGQNTDCTVAGNFSTTAPTTAAGWALVKAVKATGNVVSDGTSGGNLIATATATDTSPRQGTFTPAGSASGDGWMVDFDNRGNVYNMYHHDGNNNYNEAALDCHTRSGADCAGSWPFYLKNYGLHSNGKSYIYVDKATNKIYFPTTRTPGISTSYGATDVSMGVACIDVSTNSTPRLCGESLAGYVSPTGYRTPPAAGYVALRTATYTTHKGSSTWAVNGTKIYLNDLQTGRLSCFDYSVSAACVGQPYAINGVTASDETNSDLRNIGGLLYGSAPNVAFCFNPVTNTACTGWETSIALPDYSWRIVPLPNASGTTVATCFLYGINATPMFSVQATTKGARCYTSAGAPYTTNIGWLTTYLGPSQGDWFPSGISNDPEVNGTKIYWSNNARFEKMRYFCWDVSLNAGVGGECPNFPIVSHEAVSTTNNYVNTSYTLNLDPLNSNCLWVNNDRSRITTYDAITGQLGCTSPPSTVTFSGATTVPRLSCTDENGVRAWRNVTLKAPGSATYTSVKLTVVDSSGNPISGYTDLTATLTNGSGQKYWDLTALPVSLTGQTPNFKVQFLGLTATTDAQISISAEGGSPQLCLTPVTVVKCPTGFGVLDQSALAATTSTVTGSGSSTVGGTTTPLTSSSSTVSVTAPSLTDCSSSLRGRAGYSGNGGTGGPVAGATVRLLDSSGQPVLNGLVPVTAVTDASGNYSFDALYPGSYKVAFEAPANRSLVSATTVSGAIGSTFATTSTSTTSVTASTSAVAVGTFAVVNSLYMLPMEAKPDTTSGLKGATQTINLITNPNASGTDVPSAGSTVVANSLKLCDITETSPDCTRTSVTISGVGTYSVDATGQMTFTPLANYTGTPTPLAYTVMDTAGGTGASTYTPTVIGPPTATADTTTGPLNVAQSINVLTNTAGTSDSAGTGASLDASSLTLSCPATPTTPVCSVSGGAVTIAGQGTYTKASDGTVTFTPVTNYSGTPTPVRYTVTDSSGQTATSTYTPTIIPPPTVRADITSGGWDVTQSINVVTDVVGTGTTNDAAASSDSVDSRTTLKANSITIACATATGCTQTVVNGVVTEVIMASQGTYTVNPATNVITFNPLDTFTGTARPVTYTISDNLNQTASTTYTPTVNAPTPPTADPETTSGAKGATQSIDLLPGDLTSAAGISLVPSSVRLCPATTTTPQTTTACTLETLVVPGVGTYSVVNGVMTFVPEPNYVGTPPAVVYQVTDSVGGKASSTYTPTVIPPPTARPDTTSAGWDVIQTMNVLTSATVAGTFNASLGTGDSPATGTTLAAGSIRLCAPTDVAPDCTISASGSVVIANQGTYTLNTTTGEITFDPLPTFTGPATAVTYSITDALGQKSSTTYRPTVGAPPAPSASSDAQSTGYDVPQTYTPTSNDTANTNFPLNVTTVKLCQPATTTPPVPAQAPPNCDLTTLTTDDGVYTVNTTTGAVEFNPAASFTGTVATPIIYQAKDSINRTVNSTITPTIGLPPQPTAVPDTSTGAFDTNQSITPLPNDQDTDAIPLLPATLKLCGNNPVQTPNNCTQTSLFVPGQGSYVVDPATGIVTFDPLPTFSGNATPIKYQAANKAGQTVDSTISVFVADPPLPVTKPDSSTSAMKVVQTVNPLGNDTPGVPSIPLDPKTVKLCAVANPSATPPISAEVSPNCTKTTLEIPGKGTFTVDAVTGIVSFTPIDTWHGTVPTIDYTVTDTLGRKVSSQINIVVLPPPAMAAFTDLSSGEYNTPQAIDPLTNDSPGDLTAPELSAYTSKGSVAKVPSSVRFCGPDVVGTAVDESVSPNCVATSITTGAGTYVVNTTTGIVTFTPLATFTGTDPNAPTYQTCNLVTGNWQPATPPAKCASALIIPTVGPPPMPVASPNTSSNSYDTNQVINPLTNDTANTNFPLDPTTVKLCGAGQTPNACDKTTLEVSNQGTYTLNPVTGVVTFDPLPSFTGPATQITYQVTDSLNRTVSSTINVTVGPPPAPTATNDTNSGPYDQDQTITPLSNDSAITAFPLGQTTVKLCGPDDATTSGVNESVAPNCVALSVTTVDGVYTVNTNGTVTFNPDADFTGTTTAPVTYQATDMLLRTVNATITPTVTPPPAPTATNNTSTGAYDQNQVISPLANDTPGVTSLPLLAATLKLCQVDDLATTGVNEAQSPNNCTATSVTIPGEGTYTVNSDGTVTFNPLPSFTGTVQTPVRYQVADGLGRVVNATITPSVTPPPAPVASPDTTSGLQDVNQSIIVTANDAAGTGSQLVTASVVLTCGSLTSPDCVKNANGSVTMAGQGTYSASAANGTVVFDPEPSYTGTARPVTYTVKDLTNQSATSTYTPTVIPAPVAVDDNSVDGKDINQVISVLGNDTTPAGSNTYLVPSTLKLCGTNPVQTAPTCTLTTLTTADGTYTVNSTTGDVTFDPNPTFVGTVTVPVDYQVSDNGSTVQTVTATITPTVLDKPTVRPDTTSAGWDVTQSINVVTDVAGTGTTNDAVASSDFVDPLISFEANSITIDCALAANCTETVVNGVVTEVIMAGQGTYTVDRATNVITFNPVDTFTGTALPVTYSISDDLNQTSSTTYTPTVIVPPAPTASPDTVELLPGQSKVFSSIFDGQTGDTDPALATTGAGAPGFTNSTVCIIDPATSVCDTDGIVTIPGQGTYTLNSTTGIVTYAALSTATPGAKTPITYQISDGLGRSVTSTLTPSITPAPVANPDFSSGVQGAIQTLSPVGNDRPGGGTSTELFPDTRAQIPSGIFLCAANQPPPDCAASTVTVTDPVTNATLGVLTVAASGLVTFTPEPNFVGTTPPIGYQIPDNLGQKAYSTITITVVPPPAPSATIDTGSAEYNKPVTLKPWINDSAGSIPAGSSAPAPSLIATSIKLCGDNSTFVAMSTTPADCTATKVKTVEGTYEVNAITGEVVFTPNPNMVDPITGLATGKGFVGTVKYPPTYQIWNNWTGLGGAKSATALLVPTIAPPGAPAATVDITKTKPGTSVVLNPVSNDKPGTAALDPTTIRLCGTGEISPACTQMSVTTLDGLYVVDPTTGQVTFTPRDGFTGQATIPYIIKDGLGMMALSNLIITVEDTAVVPVAKKTKVGLAKTGGTRPDLLLLLGLVAIAAAGGLRVLGRKK